MEACFIGHRTIERREELLSLLKETVVMLIKKGVTTFLFGSKSEFDNLSWEVVSELRQKYPFIKREFVRSNYQQMGKEYKEYLSQFYEQTTFPPKLEKAGKSSYVERNYTMIDRSSYCVFYYNEKYIPKRRQENKHNKLLPVELKSGTKIAYAYALKKKKEIVNLYN